LSALLSARRAEGGKELAEVEMRLKQAPATGGFAVVDVETTGCTQEVIVLSRSPSCISAPTVRSRESSAL